MGDYNKWFIIPLTDQYLDFEGRATRQQFWMFALWTLIVSVIVAIASEIADLGDIPGNLLSIGLFLPQIAFGARRLHDLGKSGWWQLLNLLPIIGWIIILVWFIRQGETGANQYGADPRQVDVSPIPVPTEEPASIPAPSSIPVPRPDEKTNPE